MPASVFEESPEFPVQEITCRGLVVTGSNRFYYRRVTESPKPDEVIRMDYFNLAEEEAPTEEHVNEEKIKYVLHKLA